MKIQLRVNSSNPRETITVEVPDDIGFSITESYREEDNADRRHRYHNYSLDSVDYEGIAFASDETPEKTVLAIEQSTRIQEALSHLTETQRRRLLLYADGMSTHEIARLEQTNQKSVYESIQEAKKKFLKFF